MLITLLSKAALQNSELANSRACGYFPREEHKALLIYVFCTKDKGDLELSNFKGKKEHTCNEWSGCLGMGIPVISLVSTQGKNSHQTNNTSGMSHTMQAQATDPQPRAADALPVESWVGRGFISLSTIFWYSALRLKGSTVKGSVPVSMAYMFTPLKRETSKCES